MIVIGIMGKKGSGKDALCEAMGQAAYRRAFHRVAFADELKIELGRACGVSVEMIEQNKDLFRPALQWWGTELRRKFTHSEGYWVDKARERIRLIAGNHGARGVASELVVCVTDVRFPNEAAMVEGFGGVIVRVVRDCRLPIADCRIAEEDGHVSETAADELRADYRVANDGTLDELKAKGAALIETILNTSTRRVLRSEAAKERKERKAGDV